MDFLCSVLFFLSSSRNGFLTLPRFGLDDSMPVLLRLLVWLFLRLFPDVLFFFSYKIFFFSCVHFTLGKRIRFVCQDLFDELAFSLLQAVRAASFGGKDLYRNATERNVKPSTKVKPSFAFHPSFFIFFGVGGSLWGRWTSCGWAGFFSPLFRCGPRSQKVLVRHHTRERETKTYWNCRRDIRVFSKKEHSRRRRWIGEVLLNRYALDPFFKFRPAALPVLLFIVPTGINGPHDNLK